MPVTQGSSRLTIGPLLQGTTGSHYNGILSGALDLTGAAASVEAVTVPPSATTADLMYTLTVDLTNHYRIWVEAGLLRFERKTTAMGKEALGGVLTFSATSHAYWRMRHDTVWDDVVFETAAKVSGAPGTWTPWPVLADQGPPSGRGIPAGGVAPRSNTAGILGRRALPAGRRAPESGPRSARTDH